MNTSFDRLTEAIRRDGVAIVPNAFDDELRQRLFSVANELGRTEAQQAKSPQSRDNAGNRSIRLRNVFSRDPVFREAATHGPVNAALQDLLGPGYLLFASAVNSVGPGERAQELHRDDMLIGLPRPFVRPLIVNTIWALSEFNAENGATLLAHGSHLHGGAEPPAADMQIASMQPGSILVYDGSVWHGAGPNTSRDDYRMGLILTYCARFIRPYEQQLKLLPLGELRAMPPLLRQLSGFDYSIGQR